MSGSPHPYSNFYLTFSLCTRNHMFNVRSRKRHYQVSLTDLHTSLSFLSSNKERHSVHDLSNILCSTPLRDSFFHSLSSVLVFNLLSVVSKFHTFRVRQFGPIKFEVNVSVDRYTIFTSGEDFRYPLPPPSLLSIVFPLGLKGHNL